MRYLYLFVILFATEPNTEYFFSQLAVNIMWYCRLKIAIRFVSRSNYSSF